MIKSMTGFASLAGEDETASVAITVRSVNHRHFDLQLRVPAALALCEPRLRAAVQRRVARGRVEVAVTLQLRRAPALEIELNEPFAAAMAHALDRARAAGVVEGPLSPGDLLRFPQALTIRERPADAAADELDGLAATVESLLDRALADLDGMREREGGYLRADLDARCATLARLADRVAQASADGAAAMQARLAARVSDLAGDAAADPQLVAQEIVRFAARSDISEELVRLRGHLEHWAVLADAPEPCGRKLDFLLQEMNREVNTIGSKAEGRAIAELIVAAKAELEKLREQVQNVE
jgi:uncharacterized protein (TIGR00255 family)